MNGRNIDESGFISCDISISNVDLRFKPTLDIVIQRITESLGSLIHSIYLYGSVGRGTAVYGVSDLDLSIIVFKPLTERQKDSFQKLEVELCSELAAISKLEFDIGTFEESYIQNDFEWRFWLKHMCACVWGKDLRSTIKPYRPSINVGLEMNKDIEEWIDLRSNGLTRENYVAKGKSIAKKILRTHYSLYCQIDNSFYSDLYNIAQVLISFEPYQSACIKEALQVSQGKIDNFSHVTSLIEGYGKTVSSLFFSIKTGTHTLSPTMRN